MAESKGINLGNGYFLHLETPKLDLSSCPANITKIIELPQYKNGWSPWWILALTLILVALIIGFLGGCDENRSRDRIHLIQELRNTPSYELHKKVEKLYESHIGFKTESLRSVEMYPDVSFGVDRFNGMRVVTVVEDLEWVMPVDRDPGRDEERVGLVNNEGGAEEARERQEVRQDDRGVSEVESEVSRGAERTEETERSEQGDVKRPPPYAFPLWMEAIEPTAADRHVNP